MKTNLTSRLVLVLCVAAALVVGCGGDDDPTTSETCNNSVESYEATLNAFIADPTNKTKCLAFKSEAADLLDCPHLAAGKRKEYEDAVAAISCD
jgi:hypothetical protein